MQILVGIFISFFIVGCSTMTQTAEQLKSLASEKKEFKVRTVWVKKTVSNELVTQRKMNRMSPLLFGDKIIAGNAYDGISIFRSENGQRLNKISIENGSEASAVVKNQNVYIGGSNGEFYSIDMSTGQINWSFKTNSENIGEPNVDDQGRVYFLAGNNILYCLDAITGKQIWLYARQDTANFTIRGASKPIIENNQVYVGFSDGSFVNLDAQKGSVKWEVFLNKNKKFRDIDSFAVIDANQIFISGYDDSLYVLDKNTGAQLWKVTSGGYQPVTIFNNKIYYPTTSGQVLALNRDNGQKIWQYNLNDGIATQIKYYKGMIVFGESQGKLVFLDANSGKIVGGFNPGRGIYSTPTIDEQNSRIYFTSGEGNLYSLEAVWGRPTWLKDELAL